MLKDSLDSAEKQVSRQITHGPHSDQQNNVLEAPALASGSVSVSCNRSRRDMHENVEVVRNLIERCFRLYMNRDEVINTVLCHLGIEPRVTTLVWQMLEEENAGFFKAYYTMLKLKQQIHLFNNLLGKQYQLMKFSATEKVPSAPMQDEIHHKPVYNQPLGYPILQQPPIPSMGQLPSTYVGNMPSGHMVHGIPAPGNFNPMQITSEKNVLMDRGAVDTVPVIPSIPMKLENSSSPASLPSDGQFPFTPSEMSGLSMETSGLDSACKSSEDLQLGPDGQIGQLTELFQSSALNPFDFVLPSLTDWPDLQDEDFCVYRVPGAGSQRGWCPWCRLS
ncbi:uncharacterized protein LOC132186655 [Corylus avellana]|uniref:uncharacterized protein LOC132186655 n=1 Tax=Corylus avellana TaxID=13451 RepID=UPI00286CBB7C|nr:uncharacterized protein LOC132186655 [Corylus avellana]XP_059456636.1 uncharacterized protein LOC132186655 [Corylus avellana]XP_059456644.1 uncharacterized protein LOC132186655 [Corylus avellana]XP_059456652.1 uncharacterized protein LOC132186655 [Corylus avellana]XP_059456661.1 uncharacterized protein LOC132186655 [Corylus avellana]XP_059456669.1 uncharacterized protein LOC132186655 [Corylus avellana]